MTFQFTEPNEEQKEKMQKFRNKFESFERDLDELTNSREKSIAISRLEEASFWLNKSIIKND